MPRKLVIFSILLVAVWMLVACDAIARQPRLEYMPVFREAACPFELPPGQVEGRTVDCGYLSVPEDRLDPESRFIRLAVAIFHPPRGVTEPDPIIYLMGGPGASSLEFIQFSFNVYYAPVLEANRDLIFFDQRGVGLSEPALDCPEADDLSLELLDNELNGAVLEQEEIGTLFMEAYQTCAQNLGAVADLSDYNTLASAADVNDLRIALGYQQVNLWGASYGTRLALGVMRDFPQGLRSVVLDAVYPPDVDLYLETPANLERSFNLLFDTCAADASCNAAFPDLRQVFLELGENLNANPVDIVVIDRLTQISYDVELSGDAFFGLMFQLLYDTKMLPVLPQLIYDASRNDFGTISRIYGSFIAQREISSRGMMFSVQCNEELAFSSLEQFEAVMQDYPDFAYFLRETSLGGIAYHVCTFWGAGQAAAIENQAVTSRIPALILQGEFDPITPPAWGEHAGETLSNSYYHLYSGVAHGASMVDCPRSMMLAFLQNPASAPQDTCIAEMADLSFAIPAVAGVAIEMTPFTSPLKGIQGIAPVAWAEVSPGVYTRGSSAVDATTLLMDSAPMPAADLLDSLAERIGFDPGLESIAQEEVGNFTWDFYSFELQGLFCDMALAADKSKSFVVLLVSEPDERSAFYSQVFISAVESLAPLE